MRMILAPLVPGHKAFDDNCGECGQTTEWHLETCAADFKDKTLTLKFFCARCRDRNKSIEWRRTVIAQMAL